MRQCEELGITWEEVPMRNKLYFEAWYEFACKKNRKCFACRYEFEHEIMGQKYEFE